MTTTPKYRLVYFDVRSLGEPIRWIFEYSGIPYVDDRLPWNYVAWAQETKFRFSSTVGQIPVLYETGKRELCQSQVISHYLASQFGLTGDNPWDNARIDEVISLVLDLFAAKKATSFEMDPQRKIKMKADLDKKFRLYYAKFSKILEEDEGPFLLGNKVTHADFWLANFIAIWDEPMKGDRPVVPDDWPQLSNDDIYVGLTTEYPLLHKHKEAVNSLKGIKEWISKRHQTIA